MRDADRMERHCPRGMEPVPDCDAVAELFDGAPHMYIDPGAGSLILPVVAAAAISILATFSRARDALKRLFRSTGRRRER
jgi:hypothetical protein